MNGAGEYVDYRIGLDTGGSFTDAVLVDGAQRVIATAKARTRHDDLARGLGEALEAVVGDRGSAVTLVSLSTTLATNALVEGRGRAVGLVLIGLEESRLGRARLLEALDGDPVLCIAGGHDAGGEERAPLDEATLIDFVRAHDGVVEAWAISALFATRNPAHERRAAALVAETAGKPTSSRARAERGARRAPARADGAPERAPRAVDRRAPGGGRGAPRRAGDRGAAHGRQGGRLADRRRGRAHLPRRDHPERSGGQPRRGAVPVRRARSARRRHRRHDDRYRPSRRRRAAPRAGRRDGRRLADDGAGRGCSHRRARRGRRAESRGGRRSIVPTRHAPGGAARAAGEPSSGVARRAPRAARGTPPTASRRALRAARANADAGRARSARRDGARAPRPRPTRTGRRRRAVRRALARASAGASRTPGAGADRRVHAERREPPDGLAR